jgi:hypothetical protein
MNSPHLVVYPRQATHVFQGNATVHFDARDAVRDRHGDGLRLEAVPLAFFSADHDRGDGARDAVI